MQAEGRQMQKYPKTTTHSTWNNKLNNSSHGLTSKLHRQDMNEMPTHEAKSLIFSDRIFQPGALLIPVPGSS